MDYLLSSKDASSSLHVLAYLFLRMGFLDKAERTYKAIIAMNKNNPVQARIYMALAYISLEKKASREALQYIHLAMQDMPISSKNAIVYLLRAKALKIEGRNEEAQKAIDEYTYHLASRDEQ